MIGNADQMPLTFDIPSESTVQTKGAKIVTIRTTGNEKKTLYCNACLHSGWRKTPPPLHRIQVEPPPPPKGVQFPKGAIVRFQQKGWMDDNLCSDWVETV